jgi:hypothetical protein
VKYVRTIVGMYDHTYFGMFCFRDLLFCVQHYMLQFRNKWLVSFINFKNVLPLVASDEIRRMRRNT